MKILVTGGTGVVGTAAIPELLRHGHTLRLLSRHADRDTPAFPAGVEAWTGDVTDSALEQALAGCDAILHLAGIVEEQPPDITFQRVNVEGTRRLVEAAEAAGRPVFVFLSSLGADVGESEYHRSKRDAEEIVRNYPGKWTILRAGNVYGPGDEIISLLLKMMRSLPAIPVVGNGDQPFQPLWCQDLASAIAKVFADPSLSGATLELAGDEVTTTEQILSELETITQRHPPRLQIPVWLTEVGTQAIEALGGNVTRWLDRARLPVPINSAKLTMLLEGNVIADPAENDLVTRLGVKPTSLHDGLRMLADLLPEQVPGDGVGAIQVTRYSAEITGSTLSPEQLMDRICENMADVMPLDFVAEPGAPEAAREGETMTAAIPGRGNIQVRVEERNPRTVTFATLEGHPLAGILEFEVQPVDDRLRIIVQIASQPANALDWIAMKTVGGPMQTANWRAVVRRIVGLSGGTAPDGVERASRTLDDEEGFAVSLASRRFIQHQQRLHKEAQIAQANVIPT